MANPYIYTFRRRLLLQVAMVGILLATGGLAALVSRSRTYSPPVELAPPTDLGLFRVSMPAGWAQTREWLTVPSAVAPHLIATEPDDGGDRPTRILGVAQHMVKGSMTPRKYLRNELGIQGEVDSTAVTVAGVEGELFELESRLTGVDTRVVATKLYAIAVVDPDLVLFVHLELPSRQPETEDRKLIRQVAKAIQRKPLPKE